LNKLKNHIFYILYKYLPVKVASRI